MAAPALTLRTYFQRFPDDDAALDYLMEVRCGKEHTCGWSQEPFQPHCEAQGVPVPVGKVR